MSYPSVDWFDGWSLTGNFTTIDLIAATTGALNGALLARRPSHYRSYTVVGVLLMALLGGITGSVTRDLLVNEIPAALTNPAYITLSIIAGIIGYLVAFKPGELFREGLFEVVTSASLPWFAIVGAQKGVQVGLPTIAVLLLAVASATSARYVIDVTSGVTPKLFVRGEWYAGTALVAAIVWVVCRHRVRGLLHRARARDAAGLGRAPGQATPGHEAPRRGPTPARAEADGQVRAGASRPRAAPGGWPGPGRDVGRRPRRTHPGPDIAHPTSTGRRDHVTHSLRVMSASLAAGRVNGEQSSPDPESTARATPVPYPAEPPGDAMGRSVLAGFDRSDVWRAIVALLASSVGLGLAGWILPGLRFDGWWQVVLVALVMALVGLVIRPLLVALATPFGMVGALVLALLGQAIVAYTALSVVPGVTVDSFLAAFWATWIVAAVATLASWVMTAGTNDAVFAHLVRGARRGKPVA